MTIEVLDVTIRSTADNLRYLQPFDSDTQTTYDLHSLLSLKNRILRTSLLLVLLSLMGGSAMGQMFAHQYDIRRFNLGFMLGANMSYVKVQYGALAPFSSKPGDVRSVDILPTPGINIGMITNLNLGYNWDLRFIPQVSLQERRFQYTFNAADFSDSLVNKTVESSWVHLPLLLKFKSDLYKNHRMYVLFGGSAEFNLVSDERALNNPDLIRIKRFNAQLEFGAGFDLYTSKVKISPEIRYSLGLLNIYSPENFALASTLKGIQAHTISLIFNFE